MFQIFRIIIFLYSRTYFNKHTHTQMQRNLIPTGYAWISLSLIHIYSNTLLSFSTSTPSTEKSICHPTFQARMRTRASSLIIDQVPSNVPTRDFVRGALVERRRSPVPRDRSVFNTTFTCTPQSRKPRCRRRSQSVLIIICRPMRTGLHLTGRERVRLCIQWLTLTITLLLNS